MNTYGKIQLLFILCIINSDYLGFNFFSESLKKSYFLILKALKTSVIQKNLTNSKFLKPPQIVILTIKKK